MNPNALTALALKFLLLKGTVLSSSGVTAGGGEVIDWRTVKSGECKGRNLDLADQVDLFISLVGEGAALALLEGKMSSYPSCLSFREGQVGDAGFPSSLQAVIQYK